MAAMFAAATISLVMTPVYRSSTTIMVATTGAGGTASDYNSIILNRQLVKTYAALVEAQDSLTEVASQLQDVSSSELAGKITVSPVKDLELLRISVKDESPDRAAFIANKTVEVLRKKTKSIYGSDNIKVISIAEAAAKQEKPDISMNTTAAGIAGLIFALMVSFWLENYYIRK
jgi:capsular polysaccharide biosynthesis protein